MSVKRIRYFSYELELPPGGYTMSRGRHLESMESSVVEIEADDGTLGYGEACTLGSAYIEGFRASVEAAVRQLAPTVLSCDPLSPDVLETQMNAALLGHRPAKAVIDAAMWDLRGKILGLPVYQLLGGCHQRRFATYYAITLGSPSEMAREATKMMDLGYRHWQLKLGEDPVEDALRARAVAAAVAGSCDFMTCDANAGWPVADALRFLNGISGVDTYLEQPCPTLAELRQLRNRSTAPLIADESIIDERDMFACVSDMSADAVNIKPARVGGITRAARIRDIAQAAGLKIMIDDPMGGQLTAAGIAHLAASCRPETFLAASQRAYTHFTGGKNRSLARGGAASSHTGSAAAAPLPGLGVDVDLTVLGPPSFEMSR